MAKISVICTFCKKPFKKEINRFNEARKFSWNLYCSRFCLGKSKLKEQTYICQNQKCSKNFMRRPKEINPLGAYYCSRSCAATVNNRVYPKTHQKIRVCITCQKNFTGDRKYCSKNCIPYREKIGPEKIIAIIKKFNEENGRIPFRKEFPYPKSARKHFGTWNKAIIAAKFKPNPVRFANKFIAKDGHKCDSLAEKIIDDWFNAKKVPHQIHARYNGTKFTADFLIEETYIEFFGLEGQLKRYDKLMKEKLRLIATKNLKLISIHPSDLFPKSKLDVLLRNFVQSNTNE